MSESPTISISSGFMPGNAANTGAKNAGEAFRPHDLRDEDRVEQLIKPRALELFVLRDLRAVRHGALRSYAAEGLHGFDARAGRT